MLGCTGRGERRRAETGRAVSGGTSLRCETLIRNGVVTARKRKRRRVGAAIVFVWCGCVWYYSRLTFTLGLETIHYDCQGLETTYYHRVCCYQGHHRGNQIIIVSAAILLYECELRPGSENQRMRNMMEKQEKDTRSSELRRQTSHKPRPTTSSYFFATLRQTTPGSKNC